MHATSFLLLQAEGCLCSSPDGRQVLVGSADGSVTLLPADLAFKGAESVPVHLHDMWAGEHMRYAGTVECHVCSALTVHED